MSTYDTEHPTGFRVNENVAVKLFEGVGFKRPGNKQWVTKASNARRFGTEEMGRDVRGSAEDEGLGSR